VGHDEPGAWVSAVSDRHGGVDGAFGSGLFPCLAVVAVAGKRPTDHDDQATVGVDDNLVVGGVSVVLRLLGNLMVTGRDKGAVDDEHGVFREA
jgi:hypothetical protein